MTRTVGWAIVVVALAFGSVGCVSTYQSARMAERGTVTAGLAITNGRHTEEFGESDNNAELIVRWAARENFEAGFRWILVSNGHNITFEPKFPIVKDTLAVAIPFGFAFAENVGSNDESELGLWQIHPTLIWSQLVTPHVELTGAGKIVLMTEDGESETIFGGNFGARISPNFPKFAFHPEIGVYTDGDSSADGVVFSFGFAFLGTFGGTTGVQP